MLATGGSWAETRRRLLSARFLPERASPADALWAASWTARIGRRLLGRLDTCLLRSVVAGALVADTPGVAVKVGVRRPWTTGDLLDAHAWLTVSNREVKVSGDAGQTLFEEVTALRLERA